MCDASVDTPQSPVRLHRHAHRTNSQCRFVHLHHSRVSIRMVSVLLFGLRARVTTSNSAIAQRIANRINFRKPTAAAALKRSCGISVSEIAYAAARAIFDPLEFVHLLHGIFRLTDNNSRFGSYRILERSGALCSIKINPEIKYGAQSVRAPPS